MRVAVLAAVIAVVVGTVGYAAVWSLTRPAPALGTRERCVATGVPIGALPPAVPAWCDLLGPAADTAVRGANSWSDGFAGGAVHGAMPASYRVFENPRAASAPQTSVYRTEHFLHNRHWMVDIAGSGAPAGVYEGSAEDFFVGPHNGGGLMRPDASFRFEDGHLLVEFETSAGMTAYGDRIWPEIVVTTSPTPTHHETNGWYAAGLFGGYASVGCAFPADRASECRVYDDEKITAWLSADSAAGAAKVFGGRPHTEPQRSAWHLCGPTDPDASCRDRFRIDFSRDGISIWVNSVLYMSHTGLPRSAQLPDELLTQPVYVYFASWAYLPEAAVARVHWGRISVNPPPLLMR
jgi:hypothetical protein